MDEDNRQTTLYNGDGVGYRDLSDAIKDVQTLDFKTAQKGALGLESGVDASSVKYGFFTSTATVKAGGINTEIVTTGTIDAANTGKCLAIAVTDGDGNTWYTVFNIVE